MVDSSAYTLKLKLSDNVALVTPNGGVHDGTTSDDEYQIEVTATLTSTDTVNSPIVNQKIEFSIDGGNAVFKDSNQAQVIIAETDSDGKATGIIISNTPTDGEVDAVMVIDENNKVYGDNQPPFSFISLTTIPHFMNDELSFETWNMFSDSNIKNRYPVTVSTQVVTDNDTPLEGVNVEFTILGDEDVETLNTIAYFYDKNQSEQTTAKRCTLKTGNDGYVYATIFSTEPAVISVVARIDDGNVIERKTKQAQMKFRPRPILPLGLNITDNNAAADGKSTDKITVSINQTDKTPGHPNNVRVQLSLLNGNNLAGDASFQDILTSDASPVEGLKKNILTYDYDINKDPDNQGTSITFSSLAANQVSIDAVLPMQDVYSGSEKYDDYVNTTRGTPNGPTTELTGNVGPVSFCQAWWGISDLDVYFFSSIDNSVSASIFKNGLNQAKICINATLIDKNGNALTQKNQPNELSEVVNAISLCCYDDGGGFGTGSSYPSVEYTYDSNIFLKQINDQVQDLLTEDATVMGTLQDGKVSFYVFLTVDSMYRYSSIKIGQIIKPTGYNNTAPDISNISNGTYQQKFPLLLNLKNAITLTTEHLNSQGVKIIPPGQNNDGPNSNILPDNVDNYWRHTLYTITLKQETAGVSGNQISKIMLNNPIYVRSDHCVAWKSSANRMFQFKLYFWPTPFVYNTDGSRMQFDPSYPMSGLWPLSANAKCDANMTSNKGKLLVSLFSVFNGSRYVNDLTNLYFNLTIYDLYGNSGQFSFKKNEIPTKYSDIQLDWNPLANGTDKSGLPKSDNDYGYVDYINASGAGPVNPSNPCQPGATDVVKVLAEQPTLSNSLTGRIVSTAPSTKGSVWKLGDKQGPVSYTTDYYYPMILSSTGDSTSNLTINYGNATDVTVNAVWYYITSSAYGKWQLYFPVQGSTWNYTFDSPVDSNVYTGEPEFTLMHSQIYLVPVWSNTTFCIMSVWYRDEDSPKPLMAVRNDSEIVSGGILITDNYNSNSQDFEWDLLV